MVAALTLDGVGPLLRFDGAMTAARFEGYVRHVLAPTLRAGQVVVADNLRAHHTPAVRAAIAARGAALRPLPAYSPDLNPIEEAFSKGKQSLRRAQARTDDDLRAATWAAFATITQADAAGWFAHCGYPRYLSFRDVSGYARVTGPACSAWPLPPAVDGPGGGAPGHARCVVVAG